MSSILLLAFSYYFLLIFFLPEGLHASSQRPDPAGAPAAAPAVVDFNDAHSIVHADAGTWTHRMPEAFVSNHVLPFVKQFRAQLHPRHDLQWAPGGKGLVLNHDEGMATITDYNGHSVFHHVNLDPDEQRAHRRTREVESMHDLGGLIVREMWRKAKHNCMACSGRRCVLNRPGCGLPYQIFNDRIRYLYCELTLARNAQDPLPSLKANLQCATDPPTPSKFNTMLATRYRRNSAQMCINCDLNGTAATVQGGQEGGTGEEDTAQHDQQRNDKKAKGHQQNNMDRIIGQTDQDDQLQDDPLLPIDDRFPAVITQNQRKTQQKNRIYQQMDPNLGDQQQDEEGQSGDDYRQQKRKNALLSPMRDLSPLAQRVIRVYTGRKFSFKYLINRAEGQAMAQYINKIRARIARGEAGEMPVAAGMNQIVWNHSLALDAVNLLGTSQNRAVNIVDLEVVRLLDGYEEYRNQKMMRGQQEDEDRGDLSMAYQSVDLKATDVLLMVVKNYMEMFTEQQGLKCDERKCEATCKLKKRNWEEGLKRWDTDPSEYFCYPYELLYDRALSIGCAVAFETKHKTELRGKLVCIMNTQYGHKKMLHHHSVYKAGAACTHCENGFACNHRSHLCVKSQQPQLDYGGGVRKRGAYYGGAMMDPQAEGRGRRDGMMVTEPEEEDDDDK